MVLTWVSLFTNDAITRDQFMTDFRTRVDDDNSDFLNDSQLTQIIYAGIRDINFRSGLLPEYAEVTLDASTSYALPNNFTKMQEVIYINAAGTTYAALPSSNLEEVMQNGISVTGAIPEVYVRNGDNISVFGNGATTGTLRVYGSRIPNLPTTGSSNIDLPDPYLELLFLWCEWKFWRRRREADEAALSRDLYLQMAELAKEEVTEYLLRGASFYGKES